MLRKNRLITITIIDETTVPKSPMLTLHPLQQGQGTWDGQITNYPNTQRRDVQVVQPNGYLVIQYDTDNPGVWPFHCHIAWHVSGGLYVNLMEQPAKIGDRGAVPQVSSRTCALDFPSLLSCLVGEEAVKPG